LLSPAGLEDGVAHLIYKRCFVISRFGKPGSTVRKEADQVFDKIIRPVLESLNLKGDRADRMHDPGRITDKVLRAIQQHDFCIADLTGNNPNVFYELAVAQTMERPVVLMMRAGRSVPFDVSQYDVLRYDLLPERTKDQVAQLRSYVQTVLAPGYKPPSLLPTGNPIAPCRCQQRFAHDNDPAILPYLHEFVRSANDVTIFSTSFLWADDKFITMLYEKRKRNGEVLLFIPRINEKVKLIRERTGAEIREYPGPLCVRFTLIDRNRPSGKKLRVGERLTAGFVITDFDQQSDSELLGIFTALIETVKGSVQPYESK